MIMYPYSTVGVGRLCLCLCDSSALLPGDLCELRNTFCPELQMTVLVCNAGIEQDAQDLSDLISVGGGW